MNSRGFTLIELIMVIVITGVLAGTLTVFMKPAIDSYFDTKRRADLTDMADTALRRLSKDIQGAVPNSVRSVSPSCFQLVPTIGGGRYRLAPDIDTAGSAALDTTVATSSFDVLGPLNRLPQNGDWIVIGNQNADDVYTGASRGTVDSVTTPAPAHGLHRVSLQAATQFPVGYDGGRFVVVSKDEATVFYSCNATTKTLYRTVEGFSANQATACAATSGPGVAVVATDVVGCSFVYDPNQGATPQSGFVWMRVELNRAGESATLAHGVHVANAP